MGLSKIIYKVVVDSQIMPGMNISHSFEHMVSNEEEAEEFGRDCLMLFKAWQVGFGEEDDNE